MSLWIRAQKVQRYRRFRLERLTEFVRVQTNDTTRRGAGAWIGHTKSWRKHRSASAHIWCHAQYEFILAALSSVHYVEGCPRNVGSTSSSDNDIFRSRVERDCITCESRACLSGGFPENLRARNIRKQQQDSFGFGSVRCGAPVPQYGERRQNDDYCGTPCVRMIFTKPRSQ